MLTSDELERFNESLDRCTSAPRFFDRFSTGLAYLVGQPSRLRHLRRQVL